MAIQRVTVAHNFTSTAKARAGDKAKGLVTSDEWNENHTISGLDELQDALQGVAIVSMGNDNYTMTDAEARQAGIILTNVGTGKTLTVPASAFDYLPVEQMIANAGSSDVTMILEGFPSSSITVKGSQTTDIVYSTTTGIEDIENLADEHGTHARQYSTDQILLTSQALRGTAVAGEIEYLTNTPYFTPNAANRGVLPACHMAVNAAAVSLADDTSTQNYLTAAHDTLTVAANTTYSFETILYLSTGTTNHNVQWGLGGTATISSIKWFGSGRAAAAGGASTVQGSWGDSASQTAVLAASTAAGAAIHVRGIMRIGTGGTIIPQMSFNVAPGGTNTADVNTFFSCHPIGSDTMTSVGAWA